MARAQRRSRKARRWRRPRAKPTQPATETPKPPSGGTNAGEPNGKPQPQTPPSEAQLEQERKEGEEATKGVGATPAPGSAFTIPSLPESSLRADGGAAGPDPDLPGAPRRSTGSARRGRRSSPGSTRSRPTSAQPRPLLRRRGRLDAVHALDLGHVRGRRQRRRGRGPEQSRRRDLRRRPLPLRRRDAGRHLRRDLRLQPRRLVRLRGPRQRRLLRRTKSATRPSPRGSLGPQIQVLHCDPAAPWRKQIPADYLEAFEEAAGRYELGRRGRLGAGLDRPARVELRPRHEQAPAAHRRGRSGSTRASGSATRSTATTTATSTTATSPTRRRPWRG